LLVKNREAWIDIIRQDFTEVKDHLRIELKKSEFKALSSSLKFDFSSIP